MFYLINKHKWLTSFWVLHLLRKKLGIKKIGHTWTLDPLATGLLLVATGNSTKLIPYLEKKSKTYIFAFNIDWVSPTWDLEWEITHFDEKVLEARKAMITKDSIIEIIRTKFNWKISQIPPKYSAIKIDWKKAYDLVRSGKEFEMKKREIEIFDSKLISYDFPEIKIEMTVSAGAYIRTIAEDIWKELGLWWYITLLHRNKIWEITEDMSQELDATEECNCISEEFLFPEFKKLDITEFELSELKLWREITRAWLTHWDKYFANYKWKNESLVEYRDDKLIIVRNWL
ncbi:MAG: tRNA pseudouridine synthase B [uncultured bacterium (gcode 4)]|uniref:tRNA pseudouridine(55) synthase n=1 Tax=uncultured bacterium (gcode 4) TaxID=1234023 RepID=K2G438_9BACT|nr:MAG: tRNA pseudouridine synthase B [uncultured bacterium (gcode 4)]